MVCTQGLVSQQRCALAHGHVSDGRAIVRKCVLLFPVHMRSAGAGAARDCPGRERPVSPATTILLAFAFQPLLGL